MTLGLAVSSCTVSHPDLLEALEAPLKSHQVLPALRYSKAGLQPTRRALRLPVAAAGAQL